MASIIRVKRSTGTIAPATLNYGEPGLTIGVGTHGNKGGRLFVGDNSSNPLVVGGRYYTDLLSIAPGLVAGQSNPTTAVNGFVAILDINRKVDQWNVDNITIDLNTISSTDVNGDINLDPNGTGTIKVFGDITTNLTAFNILNATATNVNAFGAATALVVGATSGIATINNPTVVGTQATQNLYNTVATNLNFAGAATALVIGATTGITTIRNASLSVPNATTLNLGATSSATSVNFQSTPNTSFVAIAATTNATSTTSGALRVAGGVGIVSNVYIGGILNLNLVSSGISTRGSAYFDTNGKLISTNSPEIGTASTSNLILTTNASNVPVWADTLDGGTF